jgi:hypothetical protein
MIVAQHFLINMLSLTKVIAQFNTRSPLVQYIDWSRWFVGLAYQGKDIVFRFIVEYSSLRDFGPY